MTSEALRPAETRSVGFWVWAMVGFNTLFLVGNGVWMLIDPLKWYFAVPGVTTTGLYNQHFIRDIGLIQIFLGVGFGLWMFRPALRVEWWGAATVWLIAHALFHVWEVAAGICAPSALARDFPRSPCRPCSESH